MTADEVMALVEKAKAAGLRRLKVGDVELEFAPPAPAGPVFPDPKKRPPGRPVPSPQDFLLWSTGEDLSIDPKPVTAADRAKAADAAPGKVN